MTSLVRTCSAIAMMLAANSLCAQEPAAATSDVDSSALRNAVTEFSVKSGKIALTSLANPGRAYLPDGTYTNDSGTILVILDGTIVRLQRESGEVTEIASVRLNPRHGIMLMPSTNALMAVSEITLPTGNFRSEDGLSTMKVLSGRPTAFTIPAPATH